MNVRKSRRRDEPESWLKQGVLGNILRHRLHDRELRKRLNLDLVCHGYFGHVVSLDSSDGFSQSYF